MKNLLPLTCLFAITCTKALSQTMEPCVINASGGSYVKGNYSYEWSIGELVLVNEMTANDGKYILTNGFLQPFVRNVHVIIPPAVFKDHEIRILNNPVKNILGIEFISDEKGKLLLSIYDERGYIKYYRAVNVNGAGAIETVNMMNFANGNYMLKADFINVDQSKNQKVRSYKIIKVH